jgi:anaerobic selenocysteine-containing dehydrogenase
VPVELSDALRPGVVSLPHGFGHDLDGVEQRVARRRGCQQQRADRPAGGRRVSGNAVLNGIPVEVAPGLTEA